MQPDHSTPVGPDSFDAIVVGSGATGGWAAKLLAEAGLRVVAVTVRATEGLIQRLKSGTP